MEPNDCRAIRLAFPDKCASPATMRGDLCQAKLLAMASTWEPHSQMVWSQPSSWSKKAVLAGVPRARDAEGHPGRQQERRHDVVRQLTAESVQRGAAELRLLVRSELGRDVFAAGPHDTGQPRPAQDRGIDADAESAAAVTSVPRGQPETGA